MPKFTCLACGYRTLTSEHDWDICPICFWEDDVMLLEGETDTESSANALWLSQAQANFVLIGACEPPMQKHVRPPLPTDERDPEWKLLPRARELIERQQVSRGRG
jgi:hypothetical protein